MTEEFDGQDEPGAGTRQVCGSWGGMMPLVGRDGAMGTWEGSLLVAAVGLGSLPVFPSSYRV